MGWSIMNNFIWVNNVKAIAIYLVVLGHFSGLESALKNFIYSFHIPIFLLISGFFLIKKLQSFTVIKLFNDNIIYMIKLYFIFSMCSIAIFIIYSLANNQFIDFIKLAYGTVYGLHGSNALLEHGNGALWYFPFFISSIVFFFCCLKLPKYLAWVVVLLFALFSATYSGFRLPWAIDIAGIGVFFLMLGGELNYYYKKIKPFFSSVKSLCFVPLVTIFLFYLTSVNETSNINQTAFGNNIFLFFVNAVIGCWILLVVAHNIKKNKLIELISSHTLIIFSIHLYFVKSFSFVALINSGFYRTLLIILLSFFITVLCMQISRLILPALNKQIKYKKEVYDKV
jgi:acyltransferase